MHDTRDTNSKPMQCAINFYLNFDCTKGNVKAIITTFTVGDQEKNLHWKIVCLMLIMSQSLSVILIHRICDKNCSKILFCSKWKLHIVISSGSSFECESLSEKPKSFRLRQGKKCTTGPCVYSWIGKSLRTEFIPEIGLFCHDTMWLESIIARVSLWSFYTFYQTRSFVHNSDQKEHGPDMKGQSSLDL